MKKQLCNITKVSTQYQDRKILILDVWTELVQEDFYLFCVKGNKTYLYKDGHIGVAYFDSCGEDSFYSIEYSKGTLQEYVDNLVNKLGD